MNMEKLIPAFVLSLSGLVMLVYLLPGLALVRPFVILTFMVCGPGLGLIPLLKLSGLTQTITLGLAFSLGLDTLVVLIFLYSGAWPVEWMLVILLIIAICGAFYQLLGLVNPGTGPKEAARPASEAGLATGTLVAPPETKGDIPPGSGYQT